MAMTANPDLTYEGKPCIHGHGTTRYIKSRQCIACVVDIRLRFALSHNTYQYHVDWRAANPDLVNKYQKTYYENNPEKIMKKTRDQYAKHSEARKAYSRKFAKDFPETARRNSSLRRTRITRAGGSFTVEQSHVILADQGHRCAYCQCDGELHIDHMISVSSGGTSWPWNIQWLCRSCNLKKSTMSDFEYRAANNLPLQNHIFLGIVRAALLI